MGNIVDMILESKLIRLALMLLSIPSFYMSFANFRRNFDAGSPQWKVWLALAGLAAFTFLVAAGASLYRHFSARFVQAMESTVATKIEQALAEDGALWARVKQSIEVVTAAQVEAGVASLRQAQEAREASYLVNLQQAYASFSKVYGLAYEFQRVSCAVDKEGRVRIKREAKLVAYRRVDGFAVYVHLPERDEEGGLLQPQIESRTEGRTLTPDDPAWLLSRMMSTVKISPPLECGDSVEFVEYEGTDERLLRTPANRKSSQTPDDYFCWDVSYPTLELELRVQLPPDMVVESFEPDVWVWVGKSRPRHVEERARIRQLLKAEDYTGLSMVLKVPFPLLSVTYAISWLPDKSYSATGA